MIRTEASIRRLLTGLGRATQRGVRKCPKCHTFNGTRGTKCKNKACDQVFGRSAAATVTAGQPNGHKNDVKIIEDQLSESAAMTSNLESIRCITANNSSNIYSVRVRDRGPDYRGFVEVPIIRGLDGTADPSLNAQFIAETTARCFVEVCGTHKVVLPITDAGDGKRSHSSTTGSSSGSSHHSHHQRTSHSSSSAKTSNIRLSLIESCGHIKHSVRCVADARPIALKNSVLNQLPITDGMRQEIAELAFDTPGPLVQRVSRTSLVVKCKANTKQPLGYLHCWFTLPSMAKPNGQLPVDSTGSNAIRFSCVCKAFKSFKCANNQTNSDHNNGNELVDSRYELSAERKCVHYYACICAFASDLQFGPEFGHYIIKELPDFVCSQTTDIGSQSAGNDCLTSDGQQVDPLEIITTTTDTSPPSKRLKPSAEPIDSNGNIADAIHTRKLIDRGIIAEKDVCINFIHWLSSVTELINQTMHYQLTGKPDALVFHIPQVYFDCLQQRIASGLRRKRLPNMTTVFTRKDRPPLGTFTKYTYLITNISQVKQVFDTNRQELKLEQHFVQNRDGSYDFAQPSVTAIDLSDTTIDGSALVLPHNDNLLIKPSELKTFLKVTVPDNTATSGQTSSGSSDTASKESTAAAIPFIIEWIPDCLPYSHFGELRVELQFGHIRNGRIDNI